MTENESFQQGWKKLHEQPTLRCFYRNNVLWTKFYGLLMAALILGSVVGFTLYGILANTFTRPMVAIGVVVVLIAFALWSRYAEHDDRITDVERMLEVKPTIRKIFRGSVITAGHRP